MDTRTHLSLAAQIAGMQPIDVVAPVDRHVVVGNMRLHYLDWGGGDSTPVVLLHGGGLTAHTWDLVCLGLRDRHHCYAIDLRGHGDSEWSPGCEYELSDHLADLEGFVDRLRLRRVVLIGQSLGAIIAMRYAARHPERVAAFVPVDAGPFVRWSEGIERIADFGNDRERYDTLEDAVEHAMSFNPRRDPRLLRHSLTNSLRRLPDGSWTWKRDRRSRSRERLVAMVEEMNGLVPEAEAITCPTLVVRGADSDVFDAEHAARFADVVADGRWVTVEGAGHTVQGDNPAGLLAVLRPFLAARDAVAIEYLADLGADGIEHPGGTLLEHLRRVAELLADWGARPGVVLAGLYHAVYGTDGFPTRLRSLDQRQEVAERIGTEAEAIVYRYASCDRAFLFSQPATERRIRDRFTREVAGIGEEAFHDLLELTFANELDLINASPKFAADNGETIVKALRPFCELVSPASRCVHEEAEALRPGWRLERVIGGRERARSHGPGPIRTY
jgi:esterase